MSHWTGTETCHHPGCETRLDKRSISKVCLRHAHQEACQCQRCKRVRARRLGIELPEPEPPAAPVPDPRYTRLRGVSLPRAPWEAHQ